MISTADYLEFADDALAAMASVLADLGDEDANRAPALPGANTPYAIVTHCLGVAEFWAGHIVAGRAITRDREAEFHAAGPVGELIHRVHRARGALRADAVAAEPAAGPRGEVRERDLGRVHARTQGGALLHVLRELAQHRGHLELTRDVLRANPQQ